MFFSLNSFWLSSEKTGGVFWCPVCHRRSFPFKMGGEHIPVNFVFVIASPLEQPGLCPVSSEGGAPQGEPSCILLSYPSSEAAFDELRATPTPEDWMLEPSALLEKIRMLVMTVCVPFHWDSLLRPADGARPPHACHGWERLCPPRQSHPHVQGQAGARHGSGARPRVAWLSF